MKRFCIYTIDDATRIVSTQQAADFAYGIEFDIKTPRGDFHVDMDKPGRVLMYSAVQAGKLPAGVAYPQEYDTNYSQGAWFTEERVVAALAKLIDDNWKRAPGARWPNKGEEVPMPTAEEAKAILARLGVPQCPDFAKEIRDDADVLDHRGWPPWL